LPRGNQIEIASRSFATQTEAVAYFKAMLSRYQPRERVNEEDSLDLAALLERHD
jgi:hypothetical protein